MSGGKYLNVGTASGAAIGAPIGSLAGMALTRPSRSDDPLSVDDDYHARLRRNTYVGGAAGALLGGAIGSHSKNMHPVVKGTLGAAGTGAALAGGTYLFNKALSAADEAHATSNRVVYANAMLEEHPKLRDLPRDDFKKAYNSVEAYAPEFLEDPYIGGELVYNVATKPNRLAALKDARALSQLVGDSDERELTKSLGSELIRAAVGSAMKKEGSMRYLSDEQRLAVIGRAQDTIEKFASAPTTVPAAPGVMSTLLAPTLGALAAAGVAYAVPAAVEAVQNMKIRANRDKYLAEMKKVHPDMRSISDSDLHIAYNSIAQHTPDVLKDPLLGGQTLKQMAQFRMANVQSLNEISRLRGQRPLDVALQTSTQFLAQGAADVAKAYTQQRVEDARNRIQQARVDQAAADAAYRAGRDTLLDTRYSEEQSYLKDRDKVRDKQFGLTHGQRVGEQRYREARDKVLDTRYGQEQVVDKARYEDTYALNYARMEMDRAKTEAQHQLAVLNAQVGAEDKYIRSFGTVTKDPSGDKTTTRPDVDNNTMFDSRARLSTIFSTPSPLTLPPLPPKRTFP